MWQFEVSVTHVLRGDDVEAYFLVNRGSSTLVYVSRPVLLLYVYCFSLPVVCLGFSILHGVSGHFKSWSFFRTAIDCHLVSHWTVISCMIILFILIYPVMIREKRRLFFTIYIHGSIQMFLCDSLLTTSEDLARILQEKYKEENVEHSDYFPSDYRTGNDINHTYQVPHEQDLHARNCGSHMDVTTNGQSSKFEPEDGQGLPNVPERSLYNEHGELKKLDSFGRWMNNEIGKDCDDSLMASESCNYWNTLETQNDDKAVSSLSGHMQLDVDSLGPSLSQVQLFSILDFSPDWAFSGFETKVNIF